MKLIKAKDIIKDIGLLFEEDDRTPVVKPAVTSIPAAPVDVPEYPKGHLELTSNQAHSSFHHPGTKFRSVRSMRQASNPIFHAHTVNGDQYMVKPHADAAERGHEPEHWEPRNAVANRLLDRMGMSHMGTHGFTGVMPGHAEMASGSNITKPDDSDSPDKTAKMHYSHIGKPAYVTAFNSNARPASQVSPQDLNNIDAHHRLTGVVHHVLMGHPDAHHGNVLIDPVNKHPVHIDNDLTLGSGHAHLNSGATEHNPEGKRALMSVYNPGEDLDYTKGKYRDSTGQERELGAVGKNYPPHIMQTIKDAASGKMSHGLSPNDHKELVSNANDLLNHGLEGTLKRRYLDPTNARKRQLGM